MSALSEEVLEKRRARWRKHSAAHSARRKAQYASDPIFREKCLEARKRTWTYIRRHSPIYFLWNNARGRSARKGWTFTIQESDIELPERCPCCEVVMAYSDGTKGRGNWGNTSPSLDRIDSAKGYEPGNVCVICYNCNAVKNNGSADLHEKIARYMRARGVG